MKLENGRVQDFRIIPSVSDTQVEFGTAKFLPSWNELPMEFKSGKHRLCDVARNAMKSGGLGGMKGEAFKAGLHPSDIERFVKAHISAKTVPEKHRIAAVAYLLNIWLKEPVARTFARA